MGHGLARDSVVQVFVSLPASRVPAVRICYSTPSALGLAAELVSGVSRITSFGHLLAGVDPEGALQSGVACRVLACFVDPSRRRIRCVRSDPHSMMLPSPRPRRLSHDSFEITFRASWKSESGPYVWASTSWVRPSSPVEAEELRPGPEVPKAWVCSRRQISPAGVVPALQFRVEAANGQGSALACGRVLVCG